MHSAHARRSLRLINDSGAISAASAWLRTLGAIGLYLLAMLALTLWRSVSPQPLATSLGWLGGLVLIPVLVTLVIGASGRIRAVAPYLLPIFLMLAASSVLTLQVMASGAQDPPGWVIRLVGAIGVWPAITVMAVAPWLLLAWPAWAIDGIGVLGKNLRMKSSSGNDRFVQGFRALAYGILTWRNPRAPFAALWAKGL